MNDNEIKEKHKNIVFLYNLYKETGDDFYKDMYFYGLDCLIGQKINDRMIEKLNNLISEFAEIKPIESFKSTVELEKRTMLQKYYDKLY